MPSNSNLLYPPSSLSSLISLATPVRLDYHSISFSYQRTHMLALQLAIPQSLYPSAILPIPTVVMNKSATGMSPNPTFVADVAKKFPKDAKLVVGALGGGVGSIEQVLRRGGETIGGCVWGGLLDLLLAFLLLRLNSRKD